ncbi:Inner membrane protein YebE [Mariniblastus fucicola]|uniref:Inner membrane protein YebE n=2 Tax=Mariniblastus fucicola TaxID=980251 RepID=A0A5B9PB46_9BACT|nr:Inner membrane protein YebE [Mariniblastus fucicola]
MPLWVSDPSFMMKEYSMDAIKLLSGLLGNKSLSSGLGGKLLGGLLGGGGGSTGGGGLGSVLGSVLGGGQQRSAGGGGISGLLGGLLGGGGGGAATAQSGGGISDLLGAVLGGGGKAPEVAQEQRSAANDQATVLIRAMVNAAKSDGRIDQTEQDNIVSKLGDEVSEAEVKFLREEFAAPLDVAGFARQVPNGLEQQVYFLSLTSIDLDTQKEAQYLGQLAQAMNLDPEVCNQIHDQVQAPRIFA